MAIKGKRRTRGTRRGVAAAPRPHLVTPKKPFFRRRGVQVTVGGVLVAGIAALVLLGLSIQRRNQRLAAEREDASTFGALAEEALRTHAVGQPFLTSYIILPELGPALGQLRAGEGDTRQLSEQARNWSDQAGEAAEAIGEVTPDLAELREARNLMRRALELYAGVADGVAVAAGLEGRARRDLVAALESQLGAAAEVWDIGWTKLTAVKSRLGILESPQPPASGVPGG